MWHSDHSVTVPHKCNYLLKNKTIYIHTLFYVAGWNSALHNATELSRRDDRGNSYYVPCVWFYKFFIMFWQTASGEKRFLGVKCRLYYCCVCLCIWHQVSYWAAKDSARCQFVCGNQCSEMFEELIGLISNVSSSWVVAWVKISLAYFSKGNKNIWHTTFKG